jgi:hypothetical protein
MRPGAGYTFIVRVFSEFKLTPISAVAVVSVIALISVVGWRLLSLAGVNAESDGFVAVENDTPTLSADAQQELALLGLATDIDPSATSTNDTVAMIGPQVVAQLLGQYFGMQEQGSYSAAAAESVAAQIAPNVRATLSYKTYEITDFKTDADTSHARMLQYRDHMRESLAPLLDNTSAEFEVYARYIETSDPAHLLTLEHMARNYRAAATATAALTIPRDAVNYHRAIVNAMSEFAAVLESLAAHAGDPLASVALLRSYNTAEQNMFNSFNNLSAYYAQKQP